MRTFVFLRVVWTIAHKELRHFWRDRGILKMVALMQCFDLVVFGSMDFNVDRVPTIVVDQDRTSQSRALLARASATGTFDIRSSAACVADAEDAIRAGSAAAAIVIPAGFARTSLGRGETTVVTLVDGSDAAIADAIETTMEGLKVTATTRQVMRDTSSVALKWRSLFNPRGSSALYLLPGLVAILLADCYLLFGVFAAAGEREAGNFERLMMTPMSRGAFVVGKLLPWVLVGSVNAALVVLALHFAFAVPLDGPVWVLAGGTTLFLLTIVSAGIFFGLGGSDEADTWGGYASLAAFWLSGFIFPHTSLPPFLRYASYVLPQTHFVEIMRGACLRGAGLHDLARPLLCLSAGPLVFGLAAVIRLRRFDR